MSIFISFEIIWLGRVSNQWVNEWVSQWVTRWVIKKLCFKRSAQLEINRNKVDDVYFNNTFMINVKMKVNKTNSLNEGENQNELFRHPVNSFDLVLPTGVSWVIIFSSINFCPFFLMQFRRMVHSVPLPLSFASFFAFTCWLVNL